MRTKPFSRLSAIFKSMLLLAFLAGMNNNTVPLHITESEKWIAIAMILGLLVSNFAKQWKTVQLKANHWHETRSISHLLPNDKQNHAVLQLDIHGNITTWGNSAASIKGYTPEEVLGHSIKAFYTAEEQEIGVPEKNMEKALQYGYLETEGWMVRKDGSTFYAKVLIKPLYDATGKHNGFTKVIKEIMEKDRIDKTLAIYSPMYAQRLKPPLAS